MGHSLRSLLPPQMAAGRHGVPGDPAPEVVGAGFKPAAGTVTAPPRP